MIVLIVLDHLTTTNYLSGWHKYGKCGQLCVKIFKISIFYQFSDFDGCNMLVIADYDSTNGSWQPLITWLDGVIMLMRLNVPNILKMMVFDHVDNFEWLNILTIGNYFVGEIHGPWGHAAVLTNGEPTAEKIVCVSVRMLVRKVFILPVWRFC